MPQHLQDRTVVSYKDESLWKSRLAVKDDGQAYIVFLRSDGRILWMNSVVFSYVEYTSLQRTVTSHFLESIPNHSD